MNHNSHIQNTFCTSQQFQLELDLKTKMGFMWKANLLQLLQSTETFWELLYFLDYKMYFASPNLGGKWGCILQSKCSLPGSLGAGRTAVEQGHRRQEQDHIFCFKIVSPHFPPLKPRCVLQPGVSYSPKITVTVHNLFGLKGHILIRYSSIRYGHSCLTNQSQIFAIFRNLAKVTTRSNRS